MLEKLCGKKEEEFDDEEEEISAESATCCGCLPLKPALQLICAYYMISILYCITEIARSYAKGWKAFAGVYGFFTIPYLVLAIFAY